MFWHKLKHKDYSLAIFSVIALLIILSVVFIIVFFLNKVDSVRQPIKDEMENYSLKTAISNQIITENYFEQMNNLYSSLENEIETSEVFGQVEETFLSVKVPQTMLDSHLQTFMKIQSLQDSVDNKKDIMVLLNELIQKNNLDYEENSN